SSDLHSVPDLVRLATGTGTTPLDSSARAGPPPPVQGREPRRVTDRGQEFVVRDTCCDLDRRPCVHTGTTVPGSLTDWPDKSPHTPLRSVAALTPGRGPPGTAPPRG